ncbi:hypothetical protein U1Q18_011944 [Sarracenia purpurea var. burkii]
MLLGAVVTDVPPGSGLDSDPAQFDHGCGEGPLESKLISRPVIDNGPGARVRKEDLVRCEEALALLEVLEVDVVEGVGSVWVHVYGYPGVHIPWAHGS